MVSFSVPEQNRKLFSVSLYTTKQQVDTVRDKPVNIMEHLATKEEEIPLRRWWRPKMELKESEYWTYSHNVDTNTTPNNIY